MERLEYHLVVQSDEVIQATFRDEAGKLLGRAQGRVNRSSLDVIEDYLEFVKEAPSRKIFSRFGTRLYNLLFAGDVGALFYQAWYKITPPSDYYVALSLTFQEEFDTKIASLPWEFIFYPPGAGAFLATHPRVAFSRQRWTDSARLIPLRGEKLRILLVHLQPNNERPVDLRRIEGLLKKQAEANPARLIEPRTLRNPTPRDLEEVLENYQPHIVHWLLHGRFTDDGTQFALVGESDEETRWYGDRSLADLFQMSRPKLVLLQACEGGRQSDVGSFAHGAAWLVRQNIPAVIAMHYPITNKHGRVLADTFYKSVIESDALDFAVQKGRRSLAMGDQKAPDDHNSRAFGSVMLWLQEGAHEILSFLPEEKQPSLPPSEPSATNLSLMLVAPDEEQNRFEATVPSDTLIGRLLRDFVEYWETEAAEAPSPQRYTLHAKSPDSEPLDVTQSLAQASIANGSELWIVVEVLAPDAPVRLTIEDQKGQYFMTALLLSTKLSQLVQAFCNYMQVTFSMSKVIVELVRGLPTQERIHRLDLQQSLYEAGVGDDALLRIYPEIA